MTDIVQVDQAQLMAALATIVGQQGMQEIEGTIINARADEMLERAEEHYAHVLLEHGLGYSNTHFDETVDRLERVRSLRAGENASRGALRRRTS